MSMPSQTAFGKYLTEHDIKIDVETLGEYVSMARRLRERPEKVAPNSPRLIGFAKQLGVPLSELQPFCKAPPMTARWLQKIESQLKSGTLPRGESHAKAMRRGRVKRQKTGNMKHPLAQLANEHGMTLGDVAEAAGLKEAVLWRASTGQMPPNHPYIAQIAEALGVPDNVVAKMQHVPPIAKYDAPRKAKKGTAVVLASKKVHGARPHPKVVPKLQLHTNGKHELNGGGGGNTQYNKLRKLDLRIRESVRGMVTTFNVGVMRGDTHMPPLPLGDFYLLLNAFLQEKGIKSSVLLEPGFPALFDPR